jgi:3-phosphoglycerate kinase
LTACASCSTSKEDDYSINVAFAPDCVGEIASELARQLESGQVLLLENLRFHAEEEANDPASQKLWPRWPRSM